MKYAHTIAITVFAAPEEDTALIKESFEKLFPSAILKPNEKIALQEENCTGFESKTIKVIRLTLTKESHTNAALKELRSHFTQEQVWTLTHQKNRLDDDLNYYLRLDKPQFLQGNWVLTDDGNCVHIKVHVAAFPKSKEAAWAVIEKMFSGQKND